MHRIFCEVQLHSATGRVSLSEPNLQNIPKDFEIKMPGKQMYRKILIIQTLEKFTVITLKFEQSGFTVELCVQKMQWELQTVYTQIRLQLL